MGIQNLIPAAKAKTLDAAKFQSFDRRPVNYYRDVFNEDDHPGAPKLDEGEFNAKVEELLAAERLRMRQQLDQSTEERFQAGLAQGRSEGSAEIKRAVELFQNYAQILQAEKRELATKAEQSALELAFLLAKKIISEELATRPEAVIDIAKRALQQVLDCDQIRLRVNSEDYEYLRTVQNELQAIVGTNATLEVKVDKSVERGGCMIETERGSLDARLSSQLETLRAGMNEPSTLKHP